MVQQSHPHNHCRFWANNSRRCTLENNGLFIPLENHIVLYCISGQYSECRQYLDFFESLKINQKSNIKNRRKFRRRPSHHSIILRYLNDHENSSCHSSTLAETVDLSNGGMQICTRQSLFNNTVIRFTYGRLSPTGPRTGLARVKWCTYRQENMKFRAGLCFDISSRSLTTVP